MTTEIPQRAEDYRWMPENSVLTEDGLKVLEGFQTVNGVNTFKGAGEYNRLRNSTERALKEKAKATGRETWMVERDAGFSLTIWIYKTDGICSRTISCESTRVADPTIFWGDLS